MKADIAQFEFVHPKLREMALEVEKHFRVEFTITSIYRIGDTGVHGQLPVRGLDLSCHNDDFGLLVKTYVNSKWQYDPEREYLDCCIYHDTGSGRHLHLQVHPNTKRF